MAPARSRRWAVQTGLAALSLASTLAGCTGGGSSPRPVGDTGPSGGNVISDFAGAWPDADAEGFRGVVDLPVIAARDIAVHDAALGITATQVALHDDLDCGDDSCRQHATVTHQLAGAGEWTYDTLIKARLNEGQWLVVWSAETFNPNLTEGTTLVLHRVLPPRAPILDRNGVALTPERAIVRIGLVPDKVTSQTFGAIGSILDVDTTSLRDRVAAAKPEWFVPVIDLRRSQFAVLRDELLQVPGVLLDTANRALAPTAQWGRAVLGSVGPATADALANAGPDAISSDEVGLSGLQSVYQKQLAGVPGVTIDLVEKSTGDVINQVLSRKPTPGEPLETTLDLETQSAAELAVAPETETTAVVVVKASTGEILAAANAPGPTSYNTAFIGRYAPGSTFKVVTAYTLMRQGVVEPATPVQCPDTTVVDGKRFKNYDRGIVGPTPSFAQAFAASCNTTMVDFADDIGAHQLAATATQFGFGASWDLGLDAFSGSVPAERDLVTRAADMIGQGKVEASPLMMAMAAAAVDSEVSRTPTLLPRVLPGTRLTELDPNVASKLQSLMRLVVTDGTGTSVDLPGQPVFAKTGTAEFQQGAKTGTNAWMIGYRGDLAFAVLVENGESGAHDAAPVVRSLLSGLPATGY